MVSVPLVDFCGLKISRLICGGNPLSGFSHFDAAMDRDFIEYYTMPNILALLDECLGNGINTFQSRGDRHQMRAFLEHRLNGGKIQWIAQTASEFADIYANIREILNYKPVAVYHHGTHVDNCWHTGRIDEVADIVKFMKDSGLPCGIASHIPDVIKYAEDHAWGTDFYMCSFYNLARKYKSAPAKDQNAYAQDQFPAEDPLVMTALMRELDKPCIGYKIMAASRNCSTPDDTRAAFRFAFDNIKPGDIVDVGMFQKYRNQAAENARIVVELLSQ
ncbi:MAG: hypothetical protein JW909_12350 [Planctomycetes bacterium]|nr:hypothetical protein [Planctomycetota bacterium]